MPNRPVVVLLDIDETLIDFNASITKVVWNSSLYFWQYCLNLLIEAASAANMDIQFGIATFKKKPGDKLSATVLEHTEEKDITISPGCGLKKWINPELVFFTDGQCKVVNAMDCVKNKIAGIEKADIIIVDDRKAEVCDIAEQNGYSAVCVGSDLVHLTQESRHIRIAKAFAAIFDKLKLPIPPGIQYETQGKEISLIEVVEALVNERNRLFSQTGKAIPSIAELLAAGIQGLDDDELALNQPS